MFIGNQEFDTDISIVNTVRQLIFTNLYSDPAYVQNLMTTIYKYIDCLSIEYDPNTYIITANVKKTAMRKIYGARFKHEPNFYYQFIASIFAEYFNNHKDKIIELLATVYQDPYDRFNKLVCSPIMSNLCHITCLSDKILVIKL